MREPLVLNGVELTQYFEELLQENSIYWHDDGYSNGGYWVYGDSDMAIIEENHVESVLIGAIKKKVREKHGLEDARYSTLLKHMMELLSEESDNYAQ